MTTKTDSSLILDPDTFDSCRPILGQIAHDFNNLLTPLLAYPSLIQHHVPAGSPAIELLNAVDKASKDMIHINEQLMLLSSRGGSERTELSMADLIGTALMRFSSEHDLSQVRIVRRIEERLPKVKINSEQFSRAVDAVLRNAYESRLSGVEIVVSLNSARISPDIRAQYGAPFAGEYIQLSIRDNGPGFSQEILPKAVMPFVTTKKELAQRGSGLGLTVAFVVCRDNGGFIHLENNVAGGAEVSLFVPAALPVPDNKGEKASPAQTQHAAQPNSNARNKKRILLVDDEKTILKLFHMIISSAIPDCEVDTAGNGKEALDLFSERHHGVLVMDLHMPVMDGQTAFQEINSLSAHRGWEPPAVVFCTGFAPPDIVSRIVAHSSNHCLLSKPVRGEVLVEAIKLRLA